MRRLQRSIRTRLIHTPASGLAFMLNENAHQPGACLCPWGISTLGDSKTRLVGVYGQNFFLEKTFLSLLFTGVCVSCH